MITGVPPRTRGAGGSAGGGRVADKGTRRAGGPPPPPPPPTATPPRHAAGTPLAPARGQAGAGAALPQAQPDDDRAVAAPVEAAVRRDRDPLVDARPGDRRRRAGRADRHP